MIQDALLRVFLPWWNDNHYLISVLFPENIANIIDGFSHIHSDWHLQIYKSLICPNNGFCSGKIKIGDPVQIHDAQKQQNYIIKMTHVRLFPVEYHYNISPCLDCNNHICAKEY